MVEGLVLHHNLSIMATDMDTNTPLAVVLNGVMGEKDALLPRSEVSMKTKLIGIALYFGYFKNAYIYMYLPSILICEKFCKKQVATHGR